MAKKKANAKASKKAGRPNKTRKTHNVKQLGEDELLRLAGVLYSSEADVYTVVEQMFGFYPSERILDRLEREADCKKCKECDIWLEAEGDFDQAVDVCDNCYELAWEDDEEDEEDE